MKIRTDRPWEKAPTHMNLKIAHFWDKISEGWHKVWGPHIHHGYYENAVTQTPLAAQEKLIEKLASLLSLSPHCHVLDAGCGMGGSSLYLAKNYHANVIGITLSKKQAHMATQFALQKNIKNVSFQVEDAVTLSSFQDNAFDMIWSLESCEQFYDKNLFIQNVFRALKPGGQFMLATWCSTHEATNARQYIKLCKSFDLPYMPTMTYYQQRLMLNQFNLQHVVDWTPYVKPSWEIGITLARSYSLWTVLRTVGLRGARFIKQLGLMKNAFDDGLIQYGVFIATKPQQ